MIIFKDCAPVAKLQKMQIKLYDLGHNLYETLLALKNTIEEDPYYVVYLLY